MPKYPARIASIIKNTINANKPTFNSVIYRIRKPFGDCSIKAKMPNMYACIKLKCAKLTIHGI